MPVCDLYIPTVSADLKQKNVVNAIYYSIKLQTTFSKHWSPVTHTTITHLALNKGDSTTTKEVGSMQRILCAPLPTYFAIVATLVYSP